MLKDSASNTCTPPSTEPVKTHPEETGLFQGLCIETEWHYRGVQLKAWGKYPAEIRDLRGLEHEWGHDTDVDAVKVYDCSAFKMRVSKATLNFSFAPSEKRSERSKDDGRLQKSHI
ncbi:unnamed protein product [Fraxinus pennsylvanica]|uniref:AP2/ERF domain-containing protein n=1 Tax=Fraxinus pennsylvanica TaxID=56036 RepID=A0AAD1ZFL1_9LAMI|nr:unnamed protein product [Fraxinus pennsylvanica]